MKHSASFAADTQLHFPFDLILAHQIQNMRFSDRPKAVLLLWIIYVIYVLFLLCFCARLFIDALWSPARKGLTYWLSIVVSNCEVVTFPLVPWVRCGA